MTMTATRKNAAPNAAVPSFPTAAIIATTSTADAAPAAQIGTVNVFIAVSTPGIAHPHPHRTPQHERNTAIMAEPDNISYPRRSFILPPLAGGAAIAPRWRWGTCSGLYVTRELPRPHVAE